MTKRFRVELIYFIVILCTLLLRILSSLDFYSYFGFEDTDLTWTIIVQIFIFGLIPISLYLLLGIKKDDGNIHTIVADFGVRRFRPSTFIIVFIISILMMIVSMGISYLWQIFLYVIGYTRIPSSTDYSSVALLFKELAITALLPGVFEEVTHRGLLYSGYKDTGYKFVIISALLFSLMHQNILQTAYTFFDGIIIALVMYYTGSIWLCMFMHFFNNAVSVIMGYADQNGGILNFINVISDFMSGTIIGLLISIVLIAASLFGLFFLFRILRRRGTWMGLVPFTLLKKPKVSLSLKEDYMFIFTIIIGIVATAYSLVWGILR